MKRILFKTFIIFIIILVILYLDARYLNPSFFQVNEIAVYSPKLNSDYNGFKIAGFSDLLYGSTTNDDTLKKVVNELNELHADIIIFTGDLYSGKEIDQETKELITNYFTNIKAKLYKFAIIGNQDNNYLSDYYEILTNSNFIILDNTNKLIYKNSSTPLNIIGLTNNEKIEELYNNEYFNITLVHYPDLAEDIPNSDLIFAGHSLGGELRIPFVGGLIKRDGAKTYTENYYQINNTKMYISNGIGTTNLKLRLFNKPSITLYRLYNE